MTITPIGAAGGEVTGSAYIVQTRRARILIDCGLFQGGRKTEVKNRAPTRPNTRLDAVLLTHAHLDHTGRLPLLAKLGYRGPLFATPATCKMTGLILRDCAKIQAQDSERRNRRLEREGKPPCEPIYSPDDAENILQCTQEVPYQKPVDVAPGVKAIWAEAGHMLGSASIQLIVDDGGREKHIVFSGDLGPLGAPILRDFEPFKHADLVICESTYGDRDHRPFRETVEEFVRVVNEAVKSGGKILVPTFAVGRAQLLTSLLAWMFRTRKAKPFPIFLDSPMAIEATKIYTQHVELFDQQMRNFIKDRPLREDLKLLKATTTADESKAINSHAGTCLIMAGAGMCNAGRILHHLKANVWKPETRVLIVGYQSPGSLGRALVDHAKAVKIHGERIVVKAQVHTMGGFSAHAGQTDLLKWIEVVAQAKPRIALIHGEDRARRALAEKVRQRFQINPIMPAQGEAIEL